MEMAQTIEGANALFCDASYVVVRANWWTAKLEEPVRKGRKPGRKKNGLHEGPIPAVQKKAESKRAKLLGLELEDVDAYIDERKQAACRIFTVAVPW
jgi:hypothetical protein